MGNARRPRIWVGCAVLMSFALGPFGVASVNAGQQSTTGTSNGVSLSQREFSGDFREGELAEVYPVGKTITLKSLPANFLGDQYDIWTGPFHLRFVDAEWLVPVAGLTAGLLVTDRDVSAHISKQPSHANTYRTLA